MSFNTDEIINPDEWRQRAKNEAEKIFNKESTRRGRTFEEIYEVCEYSHAAEQYLIETGWTDDEREYKDLFDPYFDSVEIKVTGHPDIVYIFINNKVDKEYHHEGVYKWNGHRFAKINVWKKIL